MRYIFSSFIIACVLITILGCDLLDSDESDSKPKPIPINSSIAKTVKATDVVQNEKGIFILGEAKLKGKAQVDFYLAKIDIEGNLLWEKMYGREYNEKAYAIISTKDAHLLLVGYSQSPNANIDGDALFVIKVDYSGQIIWKNTYAFDPDQGYAKFGGNKGRSVIEVGNGYIIGGVGTISQYQSGHQVPALTKIGFDGKKIWSKPLSNDYGYISGLAKFETGDRFAVVGNLPGASIPILETSSADTARIINLKNFSFGRLTFTDLVISNGNLIAPEEGGKRMLLFGINKTGSNLYSYYHDLYPRIFSRSINKLTNSSDVITTGYIVDKDGDRDVYVVRNTYILANVWRFTYDISYTDEEAIGAFALPDNGVGIIANQYYNNSSSMMLVRLGSEGNLK